MRNVNTGKFRNVRNVVSFIHLPSIPVTVSQYGKFQAFSMCIMKLKLCWQKKHICQYVYICSFIHIVAVKLHLTLVCMSPCLFHFYQKPLAPLLYLAWQSHSSSLSQHTNHKITVQISCLCTICVPHIQSSYSSSSSCYRERCTFYIYTVILYGTPAYIYLRMTQPTTFMPNLCTSWVHIVWKWICLSRPQYCVSQMQNMLFTLNLVLKHVMLS
jgi:hypothetical protein